MSKLKKALERANQNRGSANSILNRSVKDQSTRTKTTIKTKVKNARNEIDVNYSHTKILDIDIEKFKKNKIFSHIKEDRMSDQIDILRTQVLNKLHEIDGNTVMVTSSNPGEGKTFTSINLGISIAQELDKTVMIVDCDLRRPDPSHFDFARDFFGVDIKQGLSDYLLGQADLTDILLNPGIPRLTILPGGKPLPNSAELLGSPKMENLVHQMKTRYGSSRIVIFDSPSILAISDPLSFSRFVDGILLVVEAERTSSEDLKAVMELLKGRTILGTILNKIISR